MSTLTVGGNEHDLNALFQTNPLQELLKSLAAQVASQQQMIEQLQLEVKSQGSAGAERSDQLEEILNTKADDKALKELAEKIKKEQSETKSETDKFQQDVQMRFKKTNDRLLSHDNAFMEVRRAVEGKADSKSVSALSARVDKCALQEDFIVTTTKLRKAITELGEKHDKFEGSTQLCFTGHDKRIKALEDGVPLFETKQNALATKSKLETALSEQEAARETLAKSVAEKATAFEKDVQAKFTEAWQARDAHWKRILKLDETVNRKADRDALQRAVGQLSESISRNEKKAAEETKALHESTLTRFEDHAKQLLGHGKGLGECQSELKTKATIVEVTEMREKLSLCAIKAEMLDLVERTRRDSSNRVRMLKERIDNTDRELLRQLEESHALDSGERYEALTALIDQKVDRSAADRWLESTQQVYSELQTLAVRTQTLGQGMKVILGWVEGMADKVTGLQGTQSRMISTLKDTKAELQAFEQEAEQSRLKVGSQIKQIIAVAADAAAASVAPMQHNNAFTGASPRKPAGGRPNPSEGLVVLKQKRGEDGAYAETPNGPATIGLATPDLAAALEMAGIVDERPQTAPYKGEQERRREQLMRKRHELAESRLKQPQVKLPPARQPVPPGRGVQYSASLTPRLVELQDA